jgi:20S proteasome alpha/beta subunit
MLVAHGVSPRVVPLVTCIVGIVEPEGVLLAADSLENSYGADVTTTPKVFVADLADGGKIGIGLAGLPRVLQVLEFGVDWSALSRDEPDPIRWLVQTAIPAMREVLDTHGVPGDEGKPGTVDANLLIALGGRVFVVEAHWQIFERPRSYACIGSGSAEANGALHALAGSEMPSAELAIRAMAASATFNSTVGGDIRTWWVPA